MVLTTNCGEIVIDTFADKAPETVNAMLWLAGEGYFDSTLCHRLVTEGIFVLQCGDPTGDGTGGPEYRFGPIENAPADNVYATGVIAMARRIDPSLAEWIDAEGAFPQTMIDRIVPATTAEERAAAAAE